MPPSPTAGAASARAAGRGGVAGRLLAWIALLVAGLRVLQACGRGVLAGPSLTSPSRWLPWLAGRPPATVAFAVLRATGLALGWYLLAVTGLGLLVRLLALGPGSPARAVARLVQVVTPPGLGRVLELALGTGVAAAVAAAVSIPAGPPADADPAAGPAAVPPTTIASRLGRHGQPGQGATMRRLDGSTGPEAGGPGPARLDPPPAPGPGREPSPPARAAASWTVARGESFWIIARLALTEAWGRSPSDADVARYWTAVIDANRDRLRHGHNPDLIYPGQELALPAPPAR